MNKDDVKDLVGATAKGIASCVPVAGGFITEYIGLAQDKVRDKRLNEWMMSVTNKLQKLEVDIEHLSSDEVFYSCFQTAFFNVSKAYQKEKRDYFANALVNSIQTDLSADKQLTFLNLLDRYTLSHIALLKYFSKNNYNEEDFVRRDSSGRVTSSICGGTEFPGKYLCQKLPEFSNDNSYLQLLCNELHMSGLINEIDWKLPVTPKEARKQRITKLGEEFLTFIR